MTIDELIGKAVEKLDCIYQKFLDDFDVFMIDRGATGEEIDRERKVYACILENDRADKLAELRDWLERSGETMHLERGAETLQ